ncbi:hypothetical protein TBLA_0I03100 [Henningerozyma blattae CBS 6284]|uniref:Uncharacterized protein n=1 Tax=Henningerozyma blattae (strain ATCC 34711 / CBS 6284 / DSM 70876 / NBRC 10599 / NRRL Y-10934 / UCD 77-7) TaxID=1071380 RepID=I2H9B3_HENB6|nr:hypothetical protein TBLA_0I03100 [Tetrapisispora blattae CBS 6284]CCH62965.1 hypothetical protein TBLA_0I03100 [Tetrapisispora blattae CBS 6284]
MSNIKYPELRFLEDDQCKKEDISFLQEIQRELPKYLNDKNPIAIISVDDKGEIYVENLNSFISSNEDNASILIAPGYENIPEHVSEMPNTTLASLQGRKIVIFLTIEFPSLLTRNLNLYKMPYIELKTPRYSILFQIFISGKMSLLLKLQIILTSMNCYRNYVKIHLKNLYHPNLLLSHLLSIRFNILIVFLILNYHSMMR